MDGYTLFMRKSIHDPSGKGFQRFTPKGPQIAAPTRQSSCWKIATDFFNIQMYFVHFANSFFSFTQEFISATLHKSTNLSFREPENLRQGNFVDTGLGVGTATTESS